MTQIGRVQLATSDKISAPSGAGLRPRMSSVRSDPGLGASRPIVDVSSVIGCSELGSGA